MRLLLHNDNMKWPSSQVDELFRLIDLAQNETNPMLHSRREVILYAQWPYNPSQLNNHPKEWYAPKMMIIKFPYKYITLAFISGQWKASLSRNWTTTGYRNGGLKVDAMCSQDEEEAGHSRASADHLDQKFRNADLEIAGNTGVLHQHAKKQETEWDAHVADMWLAWLWEMQNSCWGRWKTIKSRSTSWR